jgi:hypothetical protein
MPGGAFMRSAEKRAVVAGAAGAAGAAAGGAGAATRAGAAAAGAGALTAGRAPSALTGKTPLHTEQRARTPPPGTFAGSMRNTV